MTAFHPDILPPTADPEGSERFDCTIIHEQIHGGSKTTFYDDIQNGRFIIEDYQPEYEGYEVHVFEGVVLREGNGRYSWWKKIKQGE